MGASALVIAAAFAVAFAVLVSSTTTDTAEAADVPLAEDAGAPENDVAPGDKVQIAVNGKLAQVSITATADGVGASFAANGGQSIACSDGLACDENDAEDVITVDLNVDADSGEGFILLSVSGAGADTNTAQVTKVITVSKKGLAGSLAVKASEKTIAATGGTSTITATVKDASASPAGLNGQKLTIVTTLGNLTCPSSTDGTDTIDEATNVQVCQMYTETDTTPTPNVDGVAAPTLNGAGREGVASITVTLGSFSKTITVTLFGTAKNLTAEPEQGSVEIGGSVYVVLTVTDGAGNPVAGQVITPVTSPAKEVEGPEGVDKPVLVVTEKNTPIPDPAVGDTALGRGYSMDKPAAGSAKAIPACGDDNRDTDTDESGLQELFGPDDETADEGEGTDANGQCVVYVTAPEDAANAANNATRGVHTLNFAIRTIKVSTMIEVAGKPSVITTDAPVMVDTASVTEIIVSVWDDEEVLVGITDVKVRKVGGDGIIEDESGKDADGNTTPGMERTSNGQSKFTFIAPSATGFSEILITAGAAEERVRIQIGEAAPEPEPEAPSLSPAPAGDDSLVTFSGGTVAEFAAALADACGDDARAYATDYQGEWVSFIPAAPGPVNAAFNALFADGIDRPLLITSCN